MPAESAAMLMVLPLAGQDEDAQQPPEIAA